MQTREASKISLRTCTLKNNQNKREPINFTLKQAGGFNIIRSIDPGNKPREVRETKGFETNVLRIEFQAEAENLKFEHVALQVALTSTGGVPSLRLVPTLN